jgi:hypothetical protein
MAKTAALPLKLYCTKAAFITEANPPTKAENNNGIEYPIHFNKIFLSNKKYPE